jgi:glycerophosphoryl diester phosphodiesterase
MRVIPWTVNDVKHFRKLIKLGVDGIITDYPDLIEEVTGF